MDGSRRILLGVLLFGVAVSGQSAGQTPAVSLCAPAAGMEVRGVVTVTFDVTGRAGELVQSTLEWSTDAGVSWARATVAPSSPMPNPSFPLAMPQSGVTMLWSTTADDLGRELPQDVSLRVTAVGHYAQFQLLAETLPICRGNIAAHDFDRDGDADLAIAGYAPVLILTNDGSANFTETGEIPGGIIYVPRVDFGDVDGDGDLDAVAADGYRSSLWLGDGAGDFSMFPVAPASLGSFLLWLADLNGDGRQDLLELEGAGGAFARIGDGAGGFAQIPASIPIPPDREALEIADLDGDGDQDIVGSDPLGGSRVFLNDGAAGFTAYAQLLPGGSATAVGHANGDAHVDLFLASSGSVEFWLGTGTGSFVPAGTSFAGYQIAALAAADFDADGDLDLVIGNDGAPNTLWQGNGMGGFALAADQLGFHCTSELTAADFDGDGDLDLVEGRASSESAVFLSVGNGVVSGTASLASRVDNRPVLSLNGPAPGSLQSSDVGVSATIQMSSSERTDTAIEWSSDGGATWNFATGAPASPSLNPDRARISSQPRLEFLWDTSADGLGLTGAQSVELRLQSTVLLPPGNLVTRASNLLPGGQYYYTPWVVVADFDGDGADDIARDRVIWFSDGATGIGAGSRAVPEPLAGMHLAADVDGDGDRDALGWGNPPRMAFNDGAGGFSPPIEPFGGGSNFIGGLADLTGDGLVDAILLNTGAGVVVWQNLGGGSFSQLQATPVAAFPSQILLADFTGDGATDLAVMTTAVCAKIYENDGTGRVMDQGKRVCCDAGVVTGDLDGDGDLDVAGPSGWCPNVGTGNFGPARSIDSGIVSLVMLDLDFDGDLDLVTTDGASLKCWANDGAGSFALAQELPASANLLAVGDVNGDGRVDVVAGGRQQARIFYPAAFAREAVVHLDITNGASCRITGPVGGGVDVVSLQLNLAASGATVDVVLEHSEDGGMTFAPCTPAPGSAMLNPAPGTPAGAAGFLWDTIADGVGLTAPITVQLRVTVTDPASGEGGWCNSVVRITNGCSTACGDCHPDGRASILDALDAARVSLRLLPHTPERDLCCDTNGSGTVDVLDVLALAQLSLSWPIPRMCR